MGGGKWIYLGIITLLSIIIIIQYNGISIKGKKYYQIKHRPPIVSLIKNAKQYIKDEARFAQMQLKGYVFLQDKIFEGKLPYKNKSNIKSPNVIVLFMEGTSARLLESYGGKFKNLTPNISEFANSAHSLLIKNYYNHTAATFSGTHGTIASCYPHGEGNWYNKNATAIISNRIYQTLPNILNNYNYDTIFVSPHKKDDGYTALLKMLKFKKVKTLDDRISQYPTTQIHHNSLQDNDMYEWIKEILANHQNSNPLLLSAYLFETHTGIDTPKNGVKYSIDNPVLNTLHNQDKAFGEFWQWFKDSKYAKNTIIVLTADHAHYYDNYFVPLVKEQSDYKEIFVDRIPLIIYDPIHNLPKNLDANGRTSLDLTPTILHLLDIQNERNSFLGKSLFEKSHNLNIAAIGGDFYLIHNKVVYKENEIDNLDMSIKKAFQKRKDEIELFYFAERKNKVFFEK